MVCLLWLSIVVLGSRRSSFGSLLGIRTRCLRSAERRHRDIFVGFHANTGNALALRARCAILKRFVAPAPQRAALAKAGLLDTDTLRALTAVTANRAVREGFVRHPLAARANA